MLDTGSVLLTKMRLMTVSPTNFTVQCRGQKRNNGEEHGHIFRVKMIIGDRTVRRPRPTVQALDCYRRRMPSSCSQFKVEPRFLFDSNIVECLEEVPVSSFGFF